MTFFNDILAHYGWQGIALVSLVVVLFFVQIYYYGIAYNRIFSYRLMRRKRSCENPPVSVIVVVRGEIESFIQSELPALLAQEYHTFEIVVIYIGNDIDYLGELQRFKECNAHMRLTRLEHNERIRISTKQALNIGIKSANYDKLLFTTTGAQPRSNDWISYMAKGFERGAVVAAPIVPHFEGKSSLRTYLMRLAELHEWRNSFASAVRGRLYTAPRSNFGFTRQLYNSTRGYNHLGIDCGENDLYVQSIASPKRVAMVLSPHSTVVEERGRKWSEWLEYMRYNNSTKELYPAGAKVMRRRERGSRILLFLTAIAAFLVLPLELVLFTALVLLIRYGVVVWSSRRTARKLGEKGIAWRYWIYDLIGPVLEYMIDNHSSTKNAKVWR